MAWLTPDTLAGSTSALITIPNDLALKAAVVGALADLGIVYNWEQFGTQTPEDTAAFFGELVRQLEWGYVPPTGGSVAELHEVRKTGTQSLPNIVYVTFDSVFVDPGNWWVPASNAFVVPDAGVYLVCAELNVADSTRQVTLIANTNAGYCPLGSATGNPGTANPNGAWVLNLAAGTFVQLLARTNSSTTINATSERFSRFQITRL